MGKKKAPDPIVVGKVTAFSGVPGDIFVKLRVDQSEEYYRLRVLRTPIHPTTLTIDGAPATNGDLGAFLFGYESRVTLWSDPQNAGECNRAEFLSDGG